MDDNKNMQERVVDEGYVTLPIREYNDLLRRADAAYNAITLHRRDWSPKRPLEAEIDKHWLYGLILDKACRQYGAGYLMEVYNTAPSADDLLVLDITFATLKEMMDNEN